VRKYLLNGGPYAIYSKPLGLLGVEPLAKKKGEKYECPECGLVIIIEDDGCECQECDVVCCSVPMELVAIKPKKAAAKKKKPKANPKSISKPKKKASAKKK
jgi:hypothetical protein